MYLSNIFIYPIKSLPGIALQTALTEMRGLKYDRRWMLIDSNNRFISQREFPKLTLLNIQLSEPTIKVTDNELGTLQFSIEDSNNNLLSVQVWDDQFLASEVSSHANDWFSDYLKSPVRLVKITDASVRPIPSKYGIEPSNVSFADGYPYLLTSTTSLKELNDRLSQPIEMIRFRPNFIIEGMETAFEEDLLSTFNIGNCTFRAIKPCGRCIMVNIDPNSAISSKEPLAVLSKFRRDGNKVLFGMNVISIQNGIIRIGDKLIYQKNL